MKIFKQALASVLAVVSAASVLCMPISASADTISSPYNPAQSYSTSATEIPSGTYLSPDKKSYIIVYNDNTCTLVDVTTNDGAVVCAYSMKYGISDDTIVITITENNYTSTNESTDETRFITGTVSGIFDKKITTKSGETFTKSFWG